MSHRLRRLIAVLALILAAASPALAAEKVVEAKQALPLSSNPISSCPPPSAAISPWPTI